MSLGIGASWQSYKLYKTKKIPAFAGNVMKLEICTTSYQSAVNAQNAGADRIELCAELAVGGITPSYGLLKQVIKNLKIPIFVLIRQRSGNFTYSEDEFEIIKKDIIICKKLGCQGIVSGVLNEDNTIDLERTKELIELSKPLPFTFHRAFDWTPNPLEALEQLLDLGVNRILTSGQETTAEKGVELLKQLQKKAKGNIIILPGGGINLENVLQFKEAGFQEIHTSASIQKKVNDTPKISMNSPKFLDETQLSFSDKNKIKAILKTIKSEK